MAKSKFRGIAIRGVAACVPEQKIDTLADLTFCSEEERKKIVDLTGVRGYRKTPPGVCSSDLCVRAARGLLKGLDVGPGSVDALIFASMTPDYRIPSTACILQHRLGCSSSTVAFDMNMGCSGYVVGLYNACSLLQGAGLKRVLLLAGDTQSKLCYERDKNVVFLLGDAGTATLLEADESADGPVVELFTDGGRFSSLYIPAGGARNPSTERTRQVREQADGGVRAAEHLFMDGVEIFKFSSTDVVKSLQTFMEQEQLTVERTDLLILHQANKFLTDKIARKLKFPKEKVPYSLPHYGNTGSASIPLTIADTLSKTTGSARHRCLLSGFGVGLSWGVADVMLDRIYCPPVFEYREDS